MTVYAMKTDLQEDGTHRGLWTLRHADGTPYTEEEATELAEAMDKSPAVQGGCELVELEEEDQA